MYGFLRIKDPSVFFDFGVEISAHSLIFLRVKSIKKRVVIANEVQRNEAICQVLAGFLLELGRLLRRASSQ